MRRSGFTSGRIAGGAVIAATAVGSFALALAWSDGSSLGGLRSPGQFAFFSSIARVWEFAAGALLALSVPILRRAPSTFASALGTLGATAIVFGGFAPGSYGSVSTTIVIAVCGAAALIAAGTASRNSVSGLLGSRGPVWVGDLSYSWYLWHWPFIVFARALFPAAGWAAPVAAAVSLAPAWASYRYLENPIRRSPRVRGWAVPALACTCIALPIIAAAGLARMQSHLPVMSATAQHADVVRGCDDPAPFGAPSRARCTWQVANALGTVVLVGDSQAGQFTEPVTEAANRARFNATVATLSDCPFVHPSGVLMRNRPCARFSRESLVALVRAKPSLVIIAARTDLYIEGSRAVFTKTTPPAVGPPVSTRLFSKGLRAELAALNRVDVPVIIVHPIPVLHQSPDGCAVVLLLLNRCRGSLSRAAADAELRAARESENRALAGLPSSSSMNFERELCSADTCSKLAARRKSGDLPQLRSPQCRGSANARASVLCGDHVARAESEEVTLEGRLPHDSPVIASVLVAAALEWWLVGAVWVGRSAAGTALVLGVGWVALFAERRHRNGGPMVVLMVVGIVLVIWILKTFAVAFG